jgi:hypothetical protein
VELSPPKNYRPQRALTLYVVLAGLFVAALITCNLIANKFVSVNLGFKTFQISAGVVPYPLTFLVTDILSEIYGRKLTNRVVLAGFFASLLTLLILYLGQTFPAITDSPVSNEQFAAVFQNSWRVIAASMTAYLVAQFIDVRIFHFIKKRTQGRFLWLRLVTSVLFLGVESLGFISGLILDGWLFKVIFAAADTLLIYPAVAIIRRHLGLKGPQEAALV